MTGQTRNKLLTQVKEEQQSRDCAPEWPCPRVRPRVPVAVAARLEAPAAPGTLERPLTRDRKSVV